MIRILILILFSACVEAQTINGSGTQMTINGGGTNASINHPRVAIDCEPANIPFKYSGFPYPGCLSGGTIVTIYKESETHGGAGPMVLQRSANGGVTWLRIPVIVGGTPISAIAMSLTVVESRIVIGWNLTSANVYYFAYSDDHGTTWTSGGSVTLALTGTSVLFQKAQRLPSGKLLHPYYAYPADPLAAYESGFIQSTDNGVSWEQGPIIHNQFGKLAGETAGEAVAAGRGVLSEPCVVISEVGVSDANTKMVAYIRNEEYTGFTHFYSSDGGTTWTRTATNFLVNFDPTAYRRPVSMINYEGTMYIFCGNRKSGDFGSEYVTCTPAQLYSNSSGSFSAVTRFHNGVADSYASTNDYGYPNPFIDEAGQLVVHLYDAHPENIQLDNYEIIKQIVVIP